jgi:hypothetical protein
MTALRLIRSSRFALSVLLTGLTAALGAPTPTSTTAAWPEIGRENKPWTRWWWPGSAVDKSSLTRQLEQFAAAGLGGVEITPIYGALGAEARYLKFLSPEWVAMLEHVGREGQRLGLGVDMATGTGWPFGGPWIDAAAAAQQGVIRDGMVVPEPTRMKVKRAAPGGEGLVVDPFSPDSLRKYLAPFEAAFVQLPRGLVRSQFHDSFEYYGANWTARLPEVFRAMHGYDLQTYAKELLAKPADVKTLDADTLARIKADYRETLGRLHLDYLRTWVEWAHARGQLVRNQSHGAPGNLLDLYANADIPETETFGSTPFPIPGLRRINGEYREGLDLPEPLVVRMASSAAHVGGHALASSETCTWLREHFKESLSYAKPEIDRILADGINHIFYHGAVFSPQDASWPGWLFYASTQFNPNNPLWDDFAALNAYVARAQSILQRGQPDNDILLYWPLADVWHDPKGLSHQLTVHDVKWLTQQPVGRIAATLLAAGHTFDYISDAQLQQAFLENGEIVTGARHRVIVVPATQHLPVPTAKRLAALAKSGARIIFESLPEDVPGFGRLAERRAELKAALAEITPRARVNRDILAALAAERITPESAAAAGLIFNRRVTSAGHDYFFANLTDKKFDGWLILAKPAQTAVLLDPLTGRAGAAQLRHGERGRDEVKVQLAAGETLILRLAATDGTKMRVPANERASDIADRLNTLGQIRAAGAQPWPYLEARGEPVALKGPWRVEFIKGGPVIPAAFETGRLASWTTLGGEEAQRFAGTARYTTSFNLPPGEASDWQLDLGDVRETARVKINGQPAGTAWSVPYRLRVGELLRPGRNTLEIEVTNLAANRVRDLDRRKVEWKIMREINFVNINYKPFDASGWELTPSGLLGPVTLVPLGEPR